MENTATVEQPKQTIPLRSVPPHNSMNLVKKVMPLLAIVAIVGAGVYSGLILHSLNKSKTATSSGASGSQEDLPKDVQESQAKTFKDEAEGVIEKNDKMDKYAQGTHRLIRPGGDSQTAFLTSSVLDLDSFVGKKVKIFGETFGSLQVGWLMDVGKVEEIK